MLKQAILKLLRIPIVGDILLLFLFIFIFIHAILTHKEKDDTFIHYGG